MAKEKIGKMLSGSWPALPLPKIKNKMQKENLLLKGKNNHQQRSPIRLDR